MTTATNLLDAAEARIRDVGYNAFSFRDLAADVGIKSASVHHHFPTKGALAAAVARRYADRFIDAVNADPSGDAIDIYRRIHRASLERDGRMCLCGVLAAETGGIPAEVSNQARQFFQRCVDDLAARIGGPDARARAMRTMASLEGAMLLARAFGDISAFDEATAAL